MTRFQASQSWAVILATLLLFKVSLIANSKCCYFGPTWPPVIWWSLMYMPVSVAAFESHLLDDIRVEHGQPLCDERQAAHACKDLQRWLDGVGLQQGLVSGGVETFFTWCHWFVFWTAVQHVTVIHCKESKQRTCCMFIHCLAFGTLSLESAVRRIPSLTWQFCILLRCLVNVNLVRRVVDLLTHRLYITEQNFNVDAVKM